MSNFCKCTKPKLVKVTIDHETVDVCSARLGGCGEEYSKKDTNTDKSNSRFDYGGYNTIDPDWSLLSINGLYGDED